MRRRIAPVAALVGTVLALAVGVVACGDDGGSSNNTKGDQAKLGGTVKLWIMPNGPKPKEDMDALLKPFEQKTGVKVQTEVVGWDVQFDRIRNAAVSGEAPDVTQAGTTQVPFFAALGGFENINQRVGDVGGKAAYANGVWQTTQVVGRDGTWALPWFTEARAIYYRKDVLKKAGVDEATAFTDWDAFRATLEKVKAVKSVGGEPIQPFGSPGKKAFDLVHHVMPFVWDAGGAELSADDKKSTIASPEAEQGVKFVADLLTAGLYDKSQLERDGTQVENQFKGGRLAVWIGGPWVLGSVKRADDENWTPVARKNVGIAPMPSGPVGEGVHVRGRLEPHDVQVVEEQGRGLGAHEVPVPGPDPVRLRGQAGDVPLAHRAAEGRRRDRRQLRRVLQGDPAGAHVRADPAVGADRAGLQGSLRQHPRPGRRRLDQRRRHREAAARGREGSRRTAGPGHGLTRTVSLRHEHAVRDREP